MKVLVVDDEVKVRSFVKKGLATGEMSVDTVANLEELFSSLLSVAYDVIVLDRLLGGVDALKYIAEIRQKAPHTRLIVLSALSEVDERVRGLCSGADDYLAKPFHISELVARIRALGRRGREAGPPELLTLEDLRINLETQRVERGGKRIELTPKEYKLLVYLVKKPEKIFSKVDLLNQVWEIDSYPESNVVEVLVNHLRAKVDKGFPKKLIHSRRGVGYWIGSEDL